MVGTGTKTYRYLFVFQLTWRSYDWMPWWWQAWSTVYGWYWHWRLSLSVCISADLEKLRLNALMVAGVVNCLWLVLALTLIVICLYFSWPGEATTECPDGGRRGQLSMVGTGTNTYRYLFVFQLTWRSFDWMPWWLQEWSTVYGWYSHWRWPEVPTWPPLAQTLSVTWCSLICHFCMLVCMYIVIQTDRYDISVFQILHTSTI